MSLMRKLQILFSGEKESIEFDIAGERPKLISYKINGQNYDPKMHGIPEEHIFYRTSLMIAEEAYRAIKNK